MDIIGDDRSRRMRRKGMSFREIAQESAVRLPRIRDSLRADAGTTKTGRELRREIRKAGGLKRWWDTKPAPDQRKQP